MDPDLTAGDTEFRTVSQATGPLHNTVARYGTWLLAGPAVLFMLVFCAYPLLRLAYVSVGEDALTFANYQRLFSSTAYMTIVRNTFVVSFGVMLLCLIIAFPVAYALTQYMSKAWQRRLIILVVVPYLTSQLVRIYAWQVILGDNGPLNDVIAWLGFERVLLLYNTSGMIIGMVHILLPLMILPLYATMRGIDGSLMRAATAMGAGPVRTFLMVFLPLCKPGIRSGCILVFVNTLGAYIIPSGLGGLSNLLVSNLIQAQVEGALNFGLAGAAAFILLAMTLLVFLITGGDIASTYGRGATPAPESTNRPKRLTRALTAQLLDTSVAVSVSARLWARQLAGGRRMTGFGRGVLIACTLAILIFLAAPSLIVVIISFSADSFMGFPPTEFSLRWYESFFQSPQWRSAMLLSFVFALFSALLSLALGLTVAYALVRRNMPLKRTIFALMLAPIIVPSVVNGIAVFGLLADWRAVGTPFAVLVGHTLGGVAIVVVIGMSALSGLDRKLELAASSLGAKPMRVFQSVIAPLILPGIVGSALFAFIHSFDEVIITNFVSGTRMQTLPVKMWNVMLLEVDPTIAAVSALLVMLPLIWLLTMEAAESRKTRR